MSRYAEAVWQDEQRTTVRALKDGAPHSIPVSHPDYADIVRDGIPIAAYEPPGQTYLDKRLAAYGTPRQQIEYLVEHGIDALVQRNIAIKAKYPKE